jgi:hypothetical protein
MDLILKRVCYYKNIKHNGLTLCFSLILTLITYIVPVINIKYITYLV